MNNLTAKEKAAKELIDIFLPFSHYPDHCAIVVLDKLIEYAKTFGDITESDIREFEEVKHEIIEHNPQWK
jgi:hypothetical protein